jgi:Leucine-rich repeat (LRR) protein
VLTKTPIIPDDTTVLDLKLNTLFSISTDALKNSLQKLVLFSSQISSIPQPVSPLSELKQFQAQVFPHFFSFMNC